MKKTIHKADTRGLADHGWLLSRHTFSFAGYYNPERTKFGLLRVLNDDIVKGGMGFGEHPHDNMEIVSIPLRGELAHADSTGTEQVLKVNEVQLMSAGSGLTHS
jgi:redox-sensitive bicupin YhaK (pirin superfamily)